MQDIIQSRHDTMYTEEQKRNIWEKGRAVDNYNPQMFRKDACGAWIMWDKFGDQDSIYGWEIDHILPQSLGGPDIPDNMRPLQHQNNASKGNDYPSYTAVITSDGNKNIETVRHLVVNEEIRKKLKQYERD